MPSESTLTEFEELILAIRHPAAEVAEGATVAYWLNGRADSTRDYHVRSLLESADRLATLVAGLRAYVERTSEKEAA